MTSSLTGATGLLTGLRVLNRSRVIQPLAPWTLAGVATTVIKWGTGPAGAFTALALKAPRRTAVIDDRGSLSYLEVHERSNALAHALAERGIGEGCAVAIMCRNHRGFIDATLAAAKLGASVLYLNTAFAGPQLVDVLTREQPDLLVHDEEFTELLAGAPDLHRVLAWVEDGSTAEEEGAETLDGFIARYPTKNLTPPASQGKLVILTSGTTGTPKGAPRKEAGLENAIALLSRLPLQEGWRTHIAAPLFHTWGLAHFLITSLLGSTLVLTRHFDPERAMRLTSDLRCDSLIVIPVMLQRILNLPQDLLDSIEVPHLKAVAASGSALPGDLALAWMDEYGDNLYNIYGSTEVAYATIATPADLRLAPASAGRAPAFTRVRVLDPDGEIVPAGETGRIFVSNGMLFDGYTGGGGKDVIDGFMATGDVGRLDENGLLYVEGRDDEMIVSGGENVFPKEVEDCLARHPAVVEAAAVGVPDDEFGQRLRAFVVIDESVAVPDETELREWVRSHLARFKAPRDIVVIDSLPRNITGKVLKRELTDRS